MVERNNFIVVEMEKIHKDNCSSLCQELYCSEPHTHFCQFFLNGLKVHISFCKKHALEFQGNAWQGLKALDIKPKAFGMVFNVEDRAELLQTIGVI